MEVSSTAGSRERRRRHAKTLRLRAGVGLGWVGWGGWDGFRFVTVFADGAGELEARWRRAGGGCVSSGRPAAGACEAVRTRGASGSSRRVAVPDGAGCGSEWSTARNCPLARPGRVRVRVRGVRAGGQKACHPGRLECEQEVPVQLSANQLACVKPTTSGEKTASQIGRYCCTTLQAGLMERNDA
ncbi:unnamed protein product [Protopolystoma xenopodis]|uniref:Uncharacterized protein n=1 Tax=Protopolystoma xenopodis TaxID=117903 RepID=A0A3S5CDJ6_9PLAT|nr:unnamed protein product [Protopolystoma xenopodis]